VRVQRRDRGHDQEGRHDERQRHQQGAARTTLEVAEPHRQLRGQRARHRLRDREALLVLIVRIPAALVDEVAAHVTGERDRAAEAGGAQAQEVEE
jgi:hypothetical protein